MANHRSTASTILPAVLPAAPVERRREARVTGSGLGTLVFVRESPRPLAAVVADIGAAGASLLVRGPHLLPGALMNVDCSSGRTGPHLWLTAQVRYVHPVGGTPDDAPGWRIGVAFLGVEAGADRWLRALVSAGGVDGLPPPDSSGHRMRRRRRVY